ncbi:MAG: hypothetical protein QXS69_03870 [Candidatus Aenigmatarchaeota archaeon]
MIESITQLVRNIEIKEKNEEDYIREIIRIKVERKVRQWKGYYLIEIIDKSSNESQKLFIYGKDENDLRATQKEVIDTFIKNYIVPKQEKPSRYSFYGINTKIESEDLSLEDLRNHRKDLWEYLENVHNHVIEEIRKNKKDNRVTIKIIPIPKPKKEVVIEELKKYLFETKDNGYCLFCNNEKELISSERITNIFDWLVKTNISPIYSHSEEWYEKSIRICIDCANKLERNKHLISLDDTNLKFLDWSIKIFPYFENENEYNNNIIIEFWENVNKYDSIDSIIEHYVLPQLENNIEKIILTLIFFYDKKKQEKQKRQENKKDIVLIENTRLSNLVRAYKIFKEWKEKEEIRYENLFAEKSIFSYLRDKEIENFETILLELVKKMIKLDPIDKALEIRIFSILNKKLRKIVLDRETIFDRKIEDMKNVLKTIKFILYYNQNYDKQAL